MESCRIYGNLARYIAGDIMKRLVRAPVERLKRLGSLRNQKRVITHFADQFGLVYFGFVSQRDDEHRIVHGLTLSPHHRDAHYCIGTYENYDVVYVERSDRLQNGTKKSRSVQWQIMTFDLKTTRDLPHMLLSSPLHQNNLQRQFNTKFSTKRLLALGHTQEYDASVLSRYQVYAKPADITAVENIITPKVSTILAEHFKGLSFEISRQVLYVYSEHPHATRPLLEAMLKNGKWLAEIIDQPFTEAVESN